MTYSQSVFVLLMSVMVVNACGEGLFDHYASQNAETGTVVIRAPQSTTQTSQDALDDLPDGSERAKAARQLQGKTIKDIEINGIDNSDQKKNAEVLLTLEKVKGEKITQPDYVNYLITHGEKEIQQSQQPFGYYQVAVTSKRQFEGDELTVIYTVTQGEPVTINTVDVTLSGGAMGDEDFQALLRKNPLKKGDVFNDELYEGYKSDFVALANRKGYFDGDFISKRVEVDKAAGTANITLAYDSGPRYQFDKVTFRSDGKLREKDANSENGLPLEDELLQRFVKFKPGDEYSVEDVTKLQQDLQGSGYFSRVMVSGNQDESNKLIPVDAQLAMAKNKHYAFGIGYSTDSGVRGKFDFDWRWLNRQGHTFSTHLYVSQKDSEFDNIYRIPAANPTTDYYYLRFGGWHKNDKYDSKRAFVEGGYNWRKEHWEYRIAGITAYEKFSIGEDDDSVYLTYPFAQATYTSTDNRLDPESGYQVQINAMGGVEGVLSELSFAQTNLNARYIQALTPKNRLLFRLDLGADWTDNYHRLPPSLRYFAGGDRTIRGYAYEDIGDRDGSGDNVGGKYLVVGGIEYEYYFLEKWAAAVFVDGGDAFTDGFKPKYGAGAGVHWRSPVGPIRVDVAHGFDKDYGDAIRLHLSVGAELDL